VPVHVVQIADGTAVIDKGLAAGQRVVTDGQYKLKPGVTSRGAAARAEGWPTGPTQQGRARRGRQAPSGSGN
jgi:multidrug efflux system membrane fusion protein